MTGFRVSVQGLGLGLVFHLLKKTKGQLAVNMSKKIQIKMIKQMQMARHKLTTLCSEKTPTYIFNYN